MIDVCAAIIKQKDRFLIARRSESKSQGEKWEFPGGKIEVGETPEACLRREIMEELTLEIEVESFFMENIHAYDQGSIRLLAYEARYVGGEVTLVDHSQVKWVKGEELINYEFAEADKPFVQALINREKEKQNEI